MKKIKFLVGSLLVPLLLSAPVVSAEDSPHEFSANVAYTSDYVFRGVTQTDSGPALQGGFDYSFSGFEPVNFYAGTWASNVNFNLCDGIATSCAAGDSADIEIDWYAGLTGSLLDTGITWDINGLYYMYPAQDEDDSFGVDYEFWEVNGSLSYTFPVQFEPTIKGSIAHSPDYFGSDDSSIYFTFDLGLSLPYGFNFGVLYGNLDVDGDLTTGPGGIEYDHVAVSLNKDWKMFNADVTYHTASGESDTASCFVAGGGSCGAGIVGDADDRVVFTVSASF